MNYQLMTNFLLSFLVLGTGFRILQTAVFNKGDYEKLGKAFGFLLLVFGAFFMLISALYAIVPI